jgi:hypothetical protein
MRKSAKLSAEEQFQAVQKKADKALEAKEQALEERNARISTLRTRRMIKQAADKHNAELAAKAKLAGKKKKI